MAFSSARRVSPDSLERRRFQRVAISLLGRYMLENRLEYPCQSVNMSPGGLLLVAPVGGRVGERVITYLEQIGRLEGRIVRLLPHGFAVTVEGSMRKREKLASQLTWLANRHDLGLPEDRRHERIAPRHASATLYLPDGASQDVRVVDVSLSGAALTGGRTPPIGLPVVVGRTPGRIVRHFEGGFAVEFTHLFDSETFDADVVL